MGNSLAHPEDAGKRSGRSSVPFGDLVGRHDAAATPADPFRRLWDLGYRQLVPIVPPDAEISPNSLLARRISAAQDPRGKAPGVRGGDGLWRGLNWLRHETTPANLEAWAAMGAGVGIRTGDLGDGTTLAAIDADTLDPELSRIVRGVIDRRFGLLPLRIGRPPKGLLLVRVAGEFPYSRVEFGERDKKGRLLERVEILTDGRQFVAEGIHPFTREPYRWERALLPLAELPVVEARELVALLEELRDILPAASEIVREGGAGKAPANQNSLRGDPDLVRRAVEIMANPVDLDRDAYVDIAYAIKAAVGPENEAEGREIFVEWATRWEGAADDLAPSALAETAAADFRRCQAPFRLGASWLFDRAEKLSAGSFSRAEQWFEPVGDRTPLFPEEPANPSTGSDATIAWFDPEAWVDKPIPVREWEVRDWIPRHEVTLLYGDGGVGKTLLVHQYAVAASAGVSWLGQETRPARVMCFFCEDSDDELQRRHADILRSMNLVHSDTGGRLRIASRRNVDNLMALWDRQTGEMKRRAVWEQLRADAIGFGADVVILDTIADIFAGEEQNRAQVTSFVKTVLGRLAQDIGGSVIALGHPSQAGKSSGEGTSGSTGWSNAVRSRLYLSYPSGTKTGNVRELEGKKLNYGAKGAKLKIRWNRGAFDLIASSIPVQGDAMRSAPSGVISVETSAENAVLDAIAANPGVRMNLTGKTSNYYAPTVLRKREADLLAPYSLEEIVSAVDRLDAAGVIRGVEVGKDGSRRTTYGLRIDTDKLSARSATDGDVFT